MGGPASKQWRDEADALREILLACGLDEQRKWGKPCFVYDGINICIVQKMRRFIALMFFKGALLRDEAGLLRPVGEFSRSARRLEFTTASAIAGAQGALESLVREAIAAGKAGDSLPPAPALDLPAELLERFERAPSFKAAFEALTPGRQRGYAIYFSGAKQSETRARRIEKYASRIAEGRGIHDR